MLKKIKMGILCPSEIAFRRFMPALKKIENIEFIGLAVADKSEWDNSSDDIIKAERVKADNFTAEYGGKIFISYASLISSDEIDAVYIPLPPGLHYKWAKSALENGKHVLLEKPFATSLHDTNDLINTASMINLAVHENYMFIYHSQLEYIKKLLADGVAGDIRLYRMDFAFPFRSAEDFRYNKALGGGALLDCGGYAVKLASILLGESARLIYSKLNYKSGFNVDIYGNAALQNDEGITAQISFGMDNNYKCSIEIMGSKGLIFTNRIFTAPADYEPVINIKAGNEESNIRLPCDDTFKKSIEAFANSIENEENRKSIYKSIARQAELIEKMWI